MNTQCNAQSAAGAKELPPWLFPDREGQCAGTEGLTAQENESVVPKLLRAPMNSGNSCISFIQKSGARISTPLLA